MTQIPGHAANQLLLYCSLPSSGFGPGKKEPGAGLGRQMERKGSLEALLESR